MTKKTKSRKKGVHRHRPTKNLTNHRRRRLAWLPLDVVRDLVVEYSGATSRNKYYKWYDRVGPPWVPKYPYRVYPDFFEKGGWSWFLNTNNVVRSAGPTIDALPYWDAVAYIRPFNYKTAVEYRQAQREGKHPRLHCAPNTFYSEWISWPAFLGNDAKAIVQNVKSEPTFWLITRVKDSHPTNVFRFSTVPQSQLHMVVGRVIKQYVFEEDMKPLWEETINAMSSEYPNDVDVRLVPNINGLFWELDSALLMGQHK